MSFLPTVLLLIAAVATAVFAAWRGSRPPDLQRGVRMVPWRFVMLLAATVAFFALVHLAALGGVPTR